MPENDGITYEQMKRNFPSSNSKNNGRDHEVSDLQNAQADKFKKLLKKLLQNQESAPAEKRLAYREILILQNLPTATQAQLYDDLKNFNPQAHLQYLHLQADCFQD